jgi:hypothetical protein
MWGLICRLKPQDQGFTEKRDPEPKSMSTGAEDVILDNKIKCLSLAFCFFCNLTNKNRNWNPTYMGTTNSKPPGPIRNAG